MYETGDSLGKIFSDLLDDFIPGLKKLKSLISFTRKAFRRFDERHVVFLNNILQQTQNDKENIYAEALDAADGLAMELIHEDYWDKLKNEEGFQDSILDFIELFVLLSLFAIKKEYYAYHTKSNKEKRLYFKEKTDKRRIQIDIGKEFFTCYTSFEVDTILNDEKEVGKYGWTYGGRSGYFFKRKFAYKDFTCPKISKENANILKNYFKGLRKGDIIHKKLH